MSMTLARHLIRGTGTSVKPNWRHGNLETGLTPLEALRTATINPAEFFGMKDVGTIAPRMKANLVLLDADPLKNIANTKKISSVIMRGRLYTRIQLDDLLKTSARIASNQK